MSWTTHANTANATSWGMLAECEAAGSSRAAGCNSAAAGRMAKISTKSSECASRLHYMLSARGRFRTRAIRILVLRQSGRHELLARMPLTPLTCRGGSAFFTDRFMPCFLAALLPCRLASRAGRFNHAMSSDQRAADLEPAAVS